MSSSIRLRRSVPVRVVASKSQCRSKKRSEPGVFRRQFGVAGSNVRSASESSALRKNCRVASAEVKRVSFRGTRMIPEEQKKVLDAWQTSARYWDKYRALIAQMFAPLTSG